MKSRNNEKTVRAFRENPKYDEKFCREKEATLAGVFFFVVPILFTVFCVLNFVQYEGLSLFIQIVLVGGMILRLVATMWVAKLSRDLNRNSIQWIAFAILLPGSALMVIGQKKKIYDPSEWKKHLYNHNRSITAARLTTTQQASYQLAS